jgi:hypothetical protein
MEVRRKQTRHTIAFFKRKRNDAANAAYSFAFFGLKHPDSYPGSYPGSYLLTVSGLMVDSVVGGL